VQNVQTSKPNKGAPGPAGRAAGAPGPHPEFNSDFLDWLARSRLEVEDALATHLKELEAAMGPHSRLPAAVQYSVTSGGKRLRPILVLETCRVCGGRAEAALPAALAVECVHTFSLIHDDLPAMDDDDTRRGQPTNHKVFGEGMAILAGDWLLAHAFSLLASDRYHPPAESQCPRAILPALLQALSDGTRYMIEGQGADLEGQTRAADRDLVRYVHEHKTAALIETCCRLGALCAGASGDAVAALARYGRHLGLAFQIADDLLDATGSSQQLGKQAGKDAAAAKQTYPAAFGLEASRTEAAREVEAAWHALDSFGGRADRLRDLARYVIRRDH
jgi:geranylgeranyl diphosphate synthase type II